MEVKTGYIYHIKDDYFTKVNDKGLMINHENGHSRPTYFTIKDDDILFIETGIIMHGFAGMKLPKNVIANTQTLWGSIGWATPAAMGGCLADKSRRTVLFTGEGSHQLTAMEISNMMRRGLKPIVIVLNNSGYTIERILSDNPEDSFN